MGACAPYTDGHPNILGESFREYQFRLRPAGSAAGAHFSLSTSDLPDLVGSLFLLDLQIANPNVESTYLGVPFAITPPIAVWIRPVIMPADSWVESRTRDSSPIQLSEV
jgi:hypothetical protein